MPFVNQFVFSSFQYLNYWDVQLFPPLESYWPTLDLGKMFCFPLFPLAFSPITGAIYIVYVQWICCCFLRRSFPLFEIYVSSFGWLIISFCNCWLLSFRKVFRVACGGWDDGDCLLFLCLLLIQAFG